MCSLERAAAGAPCERSIFAPPVRRGGDEAAARPIEAARAAAWAERTADAPLPPPSPSCSPSRPPLPPCAASSTTDGGRGANTGALASAGEPSVSREGVLAAGFRRGATFLFDAMRSKRKSSTSTMERIVGSLSHRNRTAATACSVLQCFSLTGMPSSSETAKAHEGD
eukprot:TRINITY_DN8402_c0_g1_i1.p1 TRINITY_DN8402_c0_g1~~TRINITY_DN8402_c0_g1_i1.p1  ORF type:complete len:168 (-),score=6.48 TRINITY_DN8402_c0_g1_i1:3-506(-)